MPWTWGGDTHTSHSVRNNNNHNNKRLRQVCVIVFFLYVSRLGTNSSPSVWPWQRCCTTRTAGCTPRTALYGARAQLPKPGKEERVTRRSTRPSFGGPPPSQPELFQLYEEPGGARLTSPAEPREAQDRERQCFVEQIIESFVPVQILDVPEPPVVLSGVQDRILQRLVEQTPMDDTEQVIDVPNIICPDRPPPCAVPVATQMAEQLVEVPWVCPSSCVLVPQIGNQLVEVLAVSQSEFQHHSVEQNVNIPVHGGVGRRAADLQGFLPGPSPTARGGHDGGSLQCFSTEHGSTEFFSWMSSRPSLGRRNGSSGTPWSTLSTSSVVRPWCRSSTLLCRRRWNSCQTCSSSSTRSRPIPSRLSKCPRSVLRTSLCARFCVTRSW